MNFMNIFEDRIAGIFGAAKAPFSFKKLAKQAVREMEDQTLVINGANTAPALYTVLIANDDDPLMAPYYPELARELKEFVKANADKKRYLFVGEPLVRFMIDPSLRGGKFSVFAENVDAPTLARLYEEERAYQKSLRGGAGKQARRDQAPSPAPRPSAPRAQTPAVPPVSIPDPAGAPAASAGLGAAAAQAANIPDPFAPEADAEPIPVPKTMTREQMAGLGGAAATGAAIGAAVASGAVSPRQQTPGVASAQLVDVVTGDTYDITSPRCIIGRERMSADIVLRDPNVSRRHAQLIFNGTDWTIEDLNSTNGSLVNNRRVQLAPLRSGDLLTFGLCTFEFRS